MKGLKTISRNPFTPKSDFIDLTLSNARQFYSSKGDPLGVKGLKENESHQESSLIVFGLDVQVSSLPFSMRHLVP